MGSTAVVFDLFHTLVDTEHLRPQGFDAVAEVAEIICAEPAELAEFWAGAYAERETTSVELVRRFCDRRSALLTVEDGRRIDAVFGVCKDDALRLPRPEMVELVESLARSLRIGVLSNCHTREVRCWEQSPFATLVSVFGRSCDIGVMKPDPRSYAWVLDPLGVEAGEATYVGNGSSDELDGTRRSGFGQVIHCNVFDSTNGLVSADEQQRRASTADVSVTTIAELRAALHAF